MIQEVLILLNKPAAVLVSNGPYFLAAALFSWPWSGCGLVFYRCSLAPAELDLQTQPAAPTNTTTHSSTMWHYATMTLCHSGTNLTHWRKTMKANHCRSPYQHDHPHYDTMWHYATNLAHWSKIWRTPHWSKTMTMTADHCHGTFNWTSLQQDILTGCFLFSKTWPWPWPFLQSLWPWRPQSYNFSSKPNSLTS